MIDSDNGLSRGRHQAIILINAGISLNRILGTNFSGILSEIHTYQFKKKDLKMSSGKWWQICLCLNVIRVWASATEPTPAMVFIMTDPFINQTIARYRTQYLTHNLYDSDSQDANYVNIFLHIYIYMHIYIISLAFNLGSDDFSISVFPNDANLYKIYIATPFGNM